MIPDEKIRVEPLSVDVLRMDDPESWLQTYQSLEAGAKREGAKREGAKREGAKREGARLVALCIVACTREGELIVGSSMMGSIQDDEQARGAVADMARAGLNDPPRIRLQGVRL